jgi:hypothetical protein
MAKKISGSGLFQLCSAFIPAFHYNTANGVVSNQVYPP